MSQTQSATRRLIGALQNIQNDPTYIGHVSDRLVRVAPWSVERLTQYLEDPVRSRDRINYHACALGSGTGELLLLLDDPASTIVCQGEGIRSDACKQLIGEALRRHAGKDFPSFTDVCRSGLSNETQ